MQKTVQKFLSVSLGVFFLILPIRSAFSDKEAPNREKTISSKNDEFYIRFIPNAEDYTEAGKGEAYRKNYAKILWSVDWFPRGRVFILNDGVHLIRLGRWATDRKDLTDLAVAFYEKGKELKRYRVKDLIHDRVYLECSVSHYFWESDPLMEELPPDGKTFNLTLIDGKIVSFDVTTGQILQKLYYTKAPSQDSKGCPAK